MIDKELYSWYALVNPRAGSGKAYKKWQKAEKFIKEKNIKMESHLAGSDGRGTEMVQRAAAAGQRHFIAIGGDGTIHEVLDGIARFSEAENVPLSEFFMAVLPLGSGNDWIRTTGVPKNIRKAIDVLAAGKIGKQDVVKISNLDAASLPEHKVLSVEYMANVGGLGLDSKVCERVNALKEQGKSGKWLYFRSLIYWLRHRRDSECAVYCDGRKIFDGIYYSVSFGNGKYSGGGLRQTPDAVMDDGLLDVTIVPKVTAGEIVIYLPRLFSDNFNKIDILVADRGKKYYITPVKNAREVIEADGDIVGQPPAEIEVMDSRLNVVMK